MNNTAKKICALICASALLIPTLGCGSQQTQTGAPSTTEAIESISATENGSTAETDENITAADVEEPAPKPKEPLPQVTQEEVPQYEGYTLLWNDEFNGDSLNTDIWSITKRQPGVTNAELQEYTDAAENVFVKDGRLILKAIKTVDKTGKDYYTSGKVVTRKKKDFTYGKVVTRAKIPEGQGLWPAIWMMPTVETLYGTWPRGGEIDIMEILGHEPAVAHGTIHYGMPHAQQQGSYKLENGTFADGFHEFSVEWEPCEMRFYVDDNLYHTVNDWYSVDSGVIEREYPAPFDQDFYMQLNLAVGGTWPGDPDETTDFVNAEFEIDYVRVYQKPEYDTNVSKPAPVFREVTKDGNLIYNGDFSEYDDLADEINWNFILNEGGKGQASIADNMVTITTDDSGKVDYSIQLVQKDLPLYNGKTYQLTFNACAAEARDMNVCVSGPTANYIRYMQDTPVKLTTDWTTYTYEFEMSEDNDNNGRIEFNMGCASSNADVFIKNVRIEEL